MAIKAGCRRSDLNPDTCLNINVQKIQEISLQFRARNLHVLHGRRDDFSLPNGRFRLCDPENEEKGYKNAEKNDQV